MTSVSTTDNKTDMKKILSLLCVVCLILGCFAGCKPAEPTAPTTPSNSGPALFVDYVPQLKLDMNSETLKQEATVKIFVDGDTTHFNVPEGAIKGGVLKARYLAVNTPESTGKIEEYGKRASQFTREALSKATSIILESDDGKWNADSTGDRYLVWVWYRTSDSEPYRNLNLELLQNGLAIASNTANNRYGSTCVTALNQAKAHKLNVFSGEKDPEFYYGEAQELTLKELRTNIEAYNGQKVAFNGVVAMNSEGSVYVEAFDEETQMYYGMSIYYGYNLSGAGLEILSMGNEVRIVGSVQYYEAGDSWQVSDLTYRQMKPKDPGNIQKLSEGHSAAYILTTAEQFLGNVELVLSEDEAPKSFPYAQLALNTTIEMKNLVVKDIYTTTGEESSSKGAMTLTCEVDGREVSVRTAVLLDDNGKLITEEAYLGKTIDVKGIVDCFGGQYQIKVFDDAYITIHN